METKEQQNVTTLHNIRGADLPPEWARRAGIGREQLVEVTIALAQPIKKQASFEDVMQLVNKIRQRVNTAAFLRDDDLYDECGLPK